MAKVFTQHFWGTYMRPNSINDLQCCIQYDNDVACRNTDTGRDRRLLPFLFGGRAMGVPTDPAISYMG